MSVFSRLIPSRNREFPCPHCGRPVVVLNAKEDGSATLKHPHNGCKAPGGDLLKAYVLLFQPRPRHPKFGDVAEALWDRHEKEMKGG